MIFAIDVHDAKFIHWNETDTPVWYLIEETVHYNLQIPYRHRAWSATTVGIGTKYVGGAV